VEVVLHPGLTRVSFRAAKGGRGKLEKLGLVHRHRGNGRGLQDVCGLWVWRGAWSSL
jgi:hypothetical protein